MARPKEGKSPAAIRLRMELASKEAVAEKNRVLKELAPDAIEYENMVPAYHVDDPELRLLPAYLEKAEFVGRRAGEHIAALTLEVDGRRFTWQFDHEPDFDY